MQWLTDKMIYGKFCTRVFISCTSMSMIGSWNPSAGFEPKSMSTDSWSQRENNKRRTIKLLQNQRRDKNCVPRNTNHTYVDRPVLIELIDFYFHAVCLKVSTCTGFSISANWIMQEDSSLCFLSWWNPGIADVRCVFHAIITIDAKCHRSHDISQLFELNLLS